MSAFNIEHIHHRRAERGVTNLVESVTDEIWTLTHERKGPGMLSSFEQQMANDAVTATGHEHRGDLSKSWALSVEQAPEPVIAKRYALENAGYEEAKKLFFDLPTHSTVLLFSPAPKDPNGRLKELGYAGHSMAYFYHILPGENERTRTIKSLTYMHGLSNKEQADILNMLHGEDVVQPTERSILLNPVGISTLTDDTASFQYIWSEMENEYSTKHRDFVLPPAKLAAEILLNGRKLRKSRDKVLALMIDELAAEIAMGKSEQEIRTRWNIMLNLADSGRLNKDFSTDTINADAHSSKQLSTYQTQAIFMQYQHLNYEPQQISTACGLSGGIGSSQGIGNSIFTTNQYSVENSQTQGSSEQDMKCVKCPECGQTVDAIVTTSSVKCPECNYTVNK